MKRLTLQSPSTISYDSIKSFYIRQRCLSLSPLTTQHTRSLCILTLLLAGDVETNPGPNAPPTCPCGFCELAVSNLPTTEAVCCDECSIWYHRSCLKMCSKDYSVLQRSNVQWLCCRCESMNVSSFTFYDLEVTQNFYEPIADESLTSEILSPTFHPLFTSTPRPNKQRQSPRPSKQTCHQSKASQTTASDADLPQKEIYAY
ncbi:hypothetical protein ACOMHN_025349 [Nucella lapillus]